MKSSIRLRISKTTLPIPNISGPWVRKVSKKVSKVPSKPRTLDVRDSKHSECSLKKSLLFSTPWTCWRTLTTSWLARFGYKRRRLAFCFRFFLHSSPWDKCRPKPSVQHTLKRTLSQRHSKRSSTHTVFPDIKKSTQPCTPFPSSRSCLVSCSATLATVGVCLLSVFGC